MEERRSPKEKVVGEERRSPKEKVVSAERRNPGGAQENTASRGGSWRKRHMGLLSEKVQDTILIGILLPWIVEIGKKVVQHFTKKADKRVDEVLGINESGKGLGDEVGFTDAVNQLNNSEKKIISEFEASFCASSVERGQDKLIAFRVFVATGVKEKGASWGSKFLRELLLNVTSEEKLKFLQNRGAFSTMQPEKKTSAAEEMVTECIIQLPEKFGDLMKQAGNKADASAKKIAKRIEKEIYARDARGRILKNADKTCVLKDSLRYGIRSVFPHAGYAWALAAFAIVVVSMLAYGFVAS